MSTTNKRDLRFAEFCVIEYLEYLEENSDQSNLSFDEYVSVYRYMLLEKWCSEAQPKIH